MTNCVLTINGGSSSVKFALFGLTEPPVRMLSGEVERIGLPNTALSAKGVNRQATKNEPFAAADLEQAGGRLIDWPGKHTQLGAVAAVGHRVVHGGPHYSGSRRITPEVMEELKRIAPLDPDHLPGELALSYGYLLGELTRVAGPEAARGRLVLAHLGSGASMAAVRAGKCVDTTAAFTPTAGLVMGTRSGDLDPGVLLYLMRSKGLTAKQIDDLVNRQSGLFGVSAFSPDMRELLDRERTDPNAAEAVELFCYQARKYAAAMASAAGGWTPWSSPGGSARGRLRFGPGSAPGWNSWACATTRGVTPLTAR